MNRSGRIKQAAKTPPPEIVHANSGHRTFWIAVILCLAAAGTYAGMLWQEFVDYDDPTYIIYNDSIQNGFSAESVKWAFTSFRQANWHPLTWLSLMMDYRIFGGKPWGFKLTNLLLHLLNTLLVFGVLKRMTAAPVRSGFVAALFALHPLHVESVAWISERKDVLSACFWLLTMWCYAGYARRGGAGRYAASLICLAMGLLAKPMLVTLPFVLLLTDLWPMRRRIAADKQVDNAHEVQTAFSRKTLSALVIEKIPFVILALASSVITFFAQRQAGAITALETYSLGVRLANAVIAYASYLARMIWPADLAVFYPHHGKAISGSSVLLCGILLAAVTIYIALRGRARPWLTAGWLWYLGSLVPVIGLIQVGAQSMADRYTYIPLIGPFVMITWTAGQWLEKHRLPRPAVAVLGSAILAALAILTSRQLAVWKNTLSLAEHCMKAQPDAYIGYSLAGSEMNRIGRPDKAIDLLSRSLELRPKNSSTHSSIAFSYLKTGQFEKAAFHYQKAVELDPENHGLYYKYACAQAMLGRHDEACENFRKAIRLAAPNPAYHHKLAMSLAQTGRLDEAITEFQQAVNCSAGNADAELLNNLGYTLLLKDRAGEAIPCFEQALARDGGFIPAELNLCLALIRLGQEDRAIKHARLFLQSHPNHADACYVLGMVLAESGRMEEAVSAFQDALKLNPNHAEASRELKTIQTPPAK